MIEYLILAFVLFVISILYLKIAVKYKIIDKPNERSSHTKITVRGGGIIFTIATILFFFFNDFQYPYLTLGVFLISVVSFLDDIYTLSSKIRFPFQFIAMALVLIEIGVPIEFMFLFYLVWGVGIINMFNFMDGINGITGLYSLSTLLGLYFINSEFKVVNPDLIIYLAISILVFGYYNFRKKAIFFAGDIGSITIGVVIFFIGLYLTIYLESPLILLTVIVYGADATNTLVYRKFFTKESVFEPHRHHIYQKLVDIKKISHLKISMIYAVIQLVVNVIVYKSIHLKFEKQFLVFAVLVICFTLFYIYLFIKLKRPKLNEQ